MSGYSKAMKGFNINFGANTIMEDNQMSLKKTCNMKAIEIRPKQVDPLPQCEAFRSEKYNCDIPGKPNQCQRSATIHIDGKNMCRPHAGRYALDLIMSGKVK